MPRQQPALRRCQREHILYTKERQALQSKTAGTQYASIFGARRLHVDICTRAACLAVPGPRRRAALYVAGGGACRRFCRHCGRALCMAIGICWRSSHTPSSRRVAKIARRVTPRHIRRRQRDHRRNGDNVHCARAACRRLDVL